MSDKCPVVHRVPVVTLQCYGKDKPFGEYHIETGELQIRDASLMDIEMQELMDYLSRNGPYGSHILFGIPKEVYELSEKFRDPSMR